MPNISNIMCKFQVVILFRLKFKASEKRIKSVATTIKVPAQRYGL